MTKRILWGSLTCVPYLENGPIIFEINLKPESENRLEQLMCIILDISLVHGIEIVPTLFIVTFCLFSSTYFSKTKASSRSGPTFPLDQKHDLTPDFPWWSPPQRFHQLSQNRILPTKLESHSVYHQISGQNPPIQFLF
jgi:hypothetical protein